MRRSRILIILVISLASSLMVTLIARHSIGRQAAGVVVQAEAYDHSMEWFRARSCSDGSLKGSYGLSLTGTLIGFGPGGAIGTLTFDGEGQMTGSGAANIIGVSRHGTVSGAYSVNPDCTGEASIISSGGLSAVGCFVIVNGGEEVMFIGARPEGSVPQAFLSGSAKKL